MEEVSVCVCECALCATRQGPFASVGLIAELDSKMVCETMGCETHIDGVPQDPAMARGQGGFVGTAGARRQLLFWVCNQVVQQRVYKVQEPAPPKHRRARAARTHARSEELKRMYKKAAEGEAGFRARRSSSGGYTPAELLFTVGYIGSRTHHTRRSRVRDAAT